MTQGPKYNPDLSTKAIAARVRDELKAALPGVKTSVKSTNSSITVEVVKLPPGVKVYSAAYLANPESEAARKHTPEFQQIATVAKGVLDAYRRDDSDSQRDYFDRNFSASVQSAFDLRDAEWTAHRLSASQI